MGSGGAGFGIGFDAWFDAGFDAGAADGGGPMPEDGGPVAGDETMVLYFCRLRTSKRVTQR